MPTATETAMAETRFRAMGSDAHVLVCGPRPESLLEQARQRVDELERRWSRFLPASEVGRLNAAAGSPVLVSEDTFTLIERAVAAWHQTDHRFDPTVLGAMVANGYDRSFESLADRVDQPLDPEPVAPPGCEGIAVDPVTRSVMLPSGLALDLGGIGKGRAADLVVAELLESGADGACVNLGGDVRADGQAPSAAGWVVGIDDPFDSRTNAATVALLHGAVVTSARTRRRWRRDGVDRHHLIDPTTGHPVDSGVAAVSVIGGEAAAAEVLAKVALIAGPAAGPDLLAAGGVAARVTFDDRTHVHIGNWEDYER